MSELEQIIMKMIAFAGEAKSCAFEAIREARHEHYEEANKILVKGNISSIKASDLHLQLLSKDNEIKLSVLLVHAEDQIMTSQMMLELAVELIEMYKKINNNST